MRIILYTGKGGVGKTCISAATACHLAALGKKVLVMSTDQAHSLRDALDCHLASEPTEISANLSACEIDAVTECEKAWGSIRAYMQELLTAKNKESLEAEELLVFPGLEELTSLFKIKEIYDQGEYDVVIVDCAPTGETLSLLKFPEMFGSFISQMLPFKRKALKVAGPAVSRVMKMPMPKDTIFDEIETLVEKMNALRELMWNKEVVSIRIVTTPEKIVIREAKRNFSYLHLYNYNVDGIFVNKIYPKESMEGYFHQWAIHQEKSLTDIRESFSGIPIFYLDLQKQELRTTDKLKEAADQLYEDVKADEILFCDTIFSIEKEANQDVMKIVLPFFTREDMELEQKGGELTITIKNERRTFTLPDKLARKDIVSAKYEEGMLNLIFE